MRSERRRLPARRAVSLAALIVAAGLSQGAAALPSGAQVTQGSATLQQQGGTLTVTTSNGTVINWQRFGIGAGETARFVQLAAASQVLNRVVGGEPSLIL
ncbi:MAG: filamentous hemagglutinin, partial [Rubrivivax sp.]